MARFRFPFPSNGKAYHKRTERQSVCPAVGLFPFPSNGKAYHKSKSATAVTVITDLFPFPSNGNAYHKLMSAFLMATTATVVSIPFKRESVSQEYSTGLFLLSAILRFHSLQTGKRITSTSTYTFLTQLRYSVSIPFKRESVSQVTIFTVLSKLLILCFHSVQTGKRITSQHTLNSTLYLTPVSIPFKRESGSKGI